MVKELVQIFLVGYEVSSPTCKLTGKQLADTNGQLVSSLTPTNFCQLKNFLSSKVFIVVFVSASFHSKLLTLL